MDTAEVSKDLKARIKEGAAWAESEDYLIVGGPEVRGCSTTIRLTEFLDTPNRVERYGLGFQVSVDAPAGMRKFQLNVRIKPELSEGPKADSNPYVVTYVVNQETGAEDAIQHEQFPDPKNYQAISKLSIQDWCMHWIARALRTGSGKFFSAHVLIS